MSIQGESRSKGEYTREAEGEAEAEAEAEEVLAVLESNALLEELDFEN